MVVMLWTNVWLVSCDPTFFVLAVHQSFQPLATGKLSGYGGFDNDTLEAKLATSDDRLPTDKVITTAPVEHQTWDV